MSCKRCIGSYVINSASAFECNKSYNIVKRKVLLVESILLHCRVLIYFRNLYQKEILTLYTTVRYILSIMYTVHNIMPSKKNSAFFLSRIPILQLLFCTFNNSNTCTVYTFYILTIQERLYFGRL